MVFRTTPKTNKVELKEYLLKIYAPKLETELEDGTVTTEPDRNFFGKINTINASGKVINRMSPSEPPARAIFCLSCC